MAKEIDVRTKTMSDVALTCRALGHGMVEKTVPRVRELELKRLGQYQESLVCFRGCGRWRTDIRDMDTDELISSTGDYEDKAAYLVQERGTGRLPRAAARGAHRVRQRQKRSRRS